MLKRRKNHSDIVIVLSFDRTQCNISLFQEVTFSILLLVFAYVLFGTAIYRNFCGASIYYFSRKGRTKSWFLREVMNMYWNSSLYLFITVSSCFVSSWILGRISIINVSDVILLTYFVLLFSTFITWTSLLMNIVSIAFNSAVSMTFILGFILLGIGNYYAMFYFILNDIDFLYANKWLLYLNPIWNLIISEHSCLLFDIDSIDICSYGFPLEISLLGNIVFLLISSLVGAVFITQVDILGDSVEG